MSLEERRCRTRSHTEPMPRLRSLLAAAGLAALGVVLASPAAAAEPSDPDWPCIQRLVPELAASQMWAGPAPENGETASPGPEVSQLVDKLASRSTPEEEAQKAVEQYADSLAPEERNLALARLFQEVLEQINRERNEIIAGIKRYTRRQQQLADKITQDSQRLADLQPGTTPDPQTQELLEARQWDLRVFEDRNRVLTQICDQPVLLEQRAFFLSRALQARLESD
jgi:hypothetical protein